MIKFIRKIIKNGRGSYYINLPKELVASMSLRERQKLTIRQSGEKIIIEDWPSSAQGYGKTKKK